MLNAAKQFIPCKTVTVRPCDKPWYNSHCRGLRRRVQFSHQLAKKAQTIANWAEIGLRIFV